MPFDLNQRVSLAEVLHANQRDLVKRRAIKQPAENLERKDASASGSVDLKNKTEKGIQN